MNKIQQETDNRLNEILKSKNLIKLSEYVDKKTKILVRDDKLDEEWYVSPRTIKRGEIIPPSIRKANAAERTKKITDRRGKGVNYCISKIKEVHGEKYSICNKDLYKNLETDIEFFCNICKKKFTTKPKYIINGHGCPTCAFNKQLERVHQIKSTEDFKDDVKRLTGDDYIVLGEYKNQYTKIKVRHKCGYEYYVTPKHFIAGSRCRKCFEIKVNKTKQKFLDFLKQYEPDYELISEFAGAKKPITLRNNKTHEEFETTYQRFLAGVRSPKDLTGGELIIDRYLKELGISFKHNYKESGLRDKRPLEFDFKISNLNIFIEYNGIQHYEPIEVFGGMKRLLETQKHDKMKVDFCKEKNYSFLVIPYTYSKEKIKEELKKFLVENNLLN